MPGTRASDRPGPPRRRRRRPVEVVIPRSRLARIERAAAAAFPEECCGLLTGTGGAGGGRAIAIARIVDSPNIAADPRRGFEIDPRVWLELGAGLAGRAERVVGLFHSHPSGPPRPSARDREAAWGEGLVWLITAVTPGRPAATSAFLLGEPDARGRARFARLRLRVTGGAGAGGGAAQNT